MAAITDIGIILLLILFNGLFSMAEFAIISARKVRLSQRAADGDRGAAVALILAEEPNRLLSAVQIGITVISIVSGAYGGAALSGYVAAPLRSVPAVASYSDLLALVLVVAVITYLTLVFGELVPKRLALANPERIAASVAVPMKWFAWVGSPLVSLLSYSTDLVLAMFGVKGSPESKVTEEEVKILIQEGTLAGVFLEEEQTMVSRILRLSDRRVSGLMTPRPEITAVDLRCPDQEQIALMRASGHSYFPVIDGDLDRIKGMVSVRDLWGRMLDGEEVSVSRALTEPLYIPESVPALKVPALFRHAGLHLGLVTDEYGSVQGLITPHDILESIVGVLPSPDQEAEPEIVRREDGSWLVDGMLPLDQFRDVVPLGDLPLEEKGYYHTIGGLVMMHLERRPQTGDRFTHGNLQFEVLDMDGNRVDKVLVTPVKAADQ